MDDTAKILNKISSSNIAVSVHETNEFLEITIGSYKEVYQGGSGAPLGGVDMGSTNVGGVNISIHYNPMMYGYSSYLNSKEVYFKTLLNKSNLNHISYKTYKSSSEQKENFEDSIKNYLNVFERMFYLEENNDIKTKTIFKVSDYFVFGYYDKEQKKYYLRKFLN